jgi:hypothetical protein
MSPSFPYSPPWWQSCISVPDEYDKILVGREGSILLDYERGGRGHRSFRTVIEPGVIDGEQFSQQELQSPRVPTISTVSDSNGVRVSSEAFCVVPPDTQFDLSPDLSREGGEEVFSGWDGPRVPRVKRAFAPACAASLPEVVDAAWGADSQAIVYVYRTAPGARCQIVLAFAEGERREAGRRMLEIKVDGAESVLLDTVARFGFCSAGFLRLSASDDDGDGIIRISVRAAQHSPDQNAFLGAIWIFADAAASDEALLKGPIDAAAFADCGHGGFRRRILLRIELTNTTNALQSRTPCLRLRTVERMVLTGGMLRIGGRTAVVGPFAKDSGDTHGTGEVIVRLEGMRLEPGESKSLILAVNRHAYEGDAPDLADYEAQRSRSAQYWDTLDLPYDVISVPDRRIQSLLDSSVRNIYQARDLERGLPAFHVGPTVYRQLWIIDGAFLLETVTTLGRGDEARSGVDYMMSFQQADGGFQLKHRYWNGCSLSEK